MLLQKRFAGWRKVKNNERTQREKCYCGRRQIEEDEAGEDEAEDEEGEENEQDEKREEDDEE